MNEIEFTENRNILKIQFDNMLLEVCQKFEAEFMNWNKLQEEFPNEHDCEVFLEEIMTEVLEEVMASGGIIL